MSIEPFDWFSRFFAGNRPFGRRNSLFEGFDEMRREMEREFEENLRDIENKVPKDLIREYVTEDDAKVREIGPYFLNSLIMDLNQIPCHNMPYNFKSKFRKYAYILSVTLSIK